jgi:hypothetical protein
MWSRVVALLVMCASAAVSAHPLHGSALAIDVLDDALTLTLQVPLSPPNTRDAAAVRDDLQIVTPAQQPFALQWQAPQQLDVDGTQQVVVQARAVPPAGSSTRLFTVAQSGVNTTDHRIYVEVRRDFAAGVLHEPQLVGVLSSKERSVVVDRGVGSWVTGTRAVFQLGRHHIADGTDHLLFLLVLLVPAAVRARDGRWREASTTKQALLQMLGVVSAFTVGHSLTLALAALDVVRVPSTPVEVVIAVSILVSAVHAWRPLFAGRESVVAGAFGIVHGLAFATTLAELGVQGRALWLSLLAFNVGIEVQQLLIVAVTMPWLLLLSRTRLASGVRALLSLIAGVAAVAWTIERVFAIETPVTIAVEAVAAHGWLVLIVLASTSLLAWWRARR